MTSDTKTRRKRPSLLLVVALSALIVAACTSVVTPSADSTAPLETQSPPRVSDVLPEGQGVSVTVDRVSDGDSLDMVGPNGNIRVRLIGINAPEGDECHGTESKAALQTLLASGPITLTPWPSERDDFGRHLGFLVADQTFVNLDLVANGHAVARAQSDHDYASDFEAAESLAADTGLGLWAADACGAATDAAVRIAEVNADAPGDDRANPNGEWVEIVNDGNTTVELGGWSIRDESTRHRYDFDDISLEPGQTARLHSGCAEDDFGRRLDLYWCDPEPPIWNNGGDTAFLQDPNGNNVDVMRTGR